MPVTVSINLLSLVLLILKKKKKKTRGKEDLVKCLACFHMGSQGLPSSGWLQVVQQPAPWGFTPVFASF